jgi:parallel beta-helix repeat protein
LLLSANVTEAKEIFVSPGSGIQTLQAAVDTASPGDTISVMPGTYNGTVDIRGAQSLTIQAIGAGESAPYVIDTGSDLFRIHDSQDVTVSGFNVGSGGTAFRVGPGQAGIVIENNTIGAQTAVRIRGGSDHRIVGNVIEYFKGAIFTPKTAISVRDADGVTISDNNATKAGGHGIRVRESSNVSIQGNEIFESAKDGIRVFQCDGVTIGSIGAGNVSSRNRASGIRVRGSNGVSIESNLVNANRRYGVRVIETDTIDSVTDVTGAGNTGQCNVESDFRVGAERESGSCSATTTTTTTSTTTTVGP